MAVFFSAVFERWVYGIGPLHHGHHGRTDVRRGSSDRSGEIALTMSSCLANGTFVICSNRTKNITTRPARTYHCKRTRRSRALCRPSVRHWLCPSWAAYTTNISECEFPTGTAYSNSKIGPPSYPEATKIAQAFVKAAPERLVWGSDWPHPGLPDNNKPNDALLFDLLTEWAPDEATRNRILVQNPEALYGFGKSA